MSTSNETMLERLPVELALSVCRYLPKKDAFNFRRVSVYCNQIAIAEIATSYPHVFKNISVMMTRTGLAIFRKLCQKVPFRKCMRIMQFLDQKLYTPETYQRAALLPPAEYIEFELAKLRQQQAEASGKISSLLTDISRMLKLSVELQAIYVGISKLSRTYDLSDAIGLRQYIMPLCVTTRPTDMLGYLDPHVRAYIEPLDLAEPMGLVFEALRQVNFTKKIVKISLQDIFGSEVPDEAYTSRNAQQLWSLIDHPSLHSVSIHDTGHPHHGDLTLSWKWTHECICAISGVEVLHLHGCNSMQCDNGGCTALFRSLNCVAFPNLRVFKLSNTWIDEQNLSRFLQSQSGHPECLGFQRCGLVCGSWKAIFEVLTCMSHLERLALQDLAEHRTPSTIVDLRNTYLGKSEEDIDVSGTEDVQKYLRLLMTDFRTLITWEMQDGSTVDFATVLLPKTTYSGHRL